MNVVLIQTPNLVVFLHLFAFVGATLLQRIQQFSLDAPKSCRKFQIDIKNFVSLLCQLTVVQRRSLLLHVTRYFVHVNQVLLDLR